MTVNCILEVSQSGKTLKLTHENGRIIMEALVHGNLLQVVENCDYKVPISKGKANIFRGDLEQLAAFEFLDMKSEEVIER